VADVAERSAATLPRPGAGRDPDALAAAAKARWSPIRTVCLLSGGADSCVLAHRCADHYDELLYIDTGTALPGVEDHVRAFARRLGRPLMIRRSTDAYRTMVVGDELWWSRLREASADRGRLLGIEEMRAADRAARRTSARLHGRPPHGFPGPGQHGTAYSRLKERRIEDALRDAKRGRPRRSAVLFLSGIRRAESLRRSRREPFGERGSAKFCSPLIDWGDGEVDAYRERHGLPLSDAAALMHRSGECNCGAFAQAAEERRLISSLWPGWWARTIGALEAEAESRGVRWCRWGGHDLAGNRATGRSRERMGVLCSGCNGRTFTEAPR
jgi:3'-phosphoadenosine 5'-phosphosulfate sulfotransferase (PAPS reductase)/FAD synthetase